MPELDKLPIKSFQPDARGPMHGVRVLDLSRLVAGNILTLALADFGADVVKVEPPQGDPLRAWLSDGVDTHWKVYGRNKKSVCLDLRTAEGKDVLLAMVRNAHVLVENYRPDTLEKMGLAPDVLHAANAGLVVVRISGWGQTGPFRHKPGFGTLVEGFSGYASMNGFPDREPVLPPIQMADNVAGLAGAFATMVALREIEVNGGRGQTVDLPLFDPLFAILGPQAAHYQVTGRVKKRTGSRSTTAGPRNVFRTRDDHWICLSASTQVMAERLFRVIGREDLIGHPDYATNAARVRNAAALEAIIGGFMGERTLEENLRFFDAADVTVGPVNDISQIVEDPYIVAREILVRMPDKDLGNIAMHNIGPRLSRTPGALRHAAPKLGQHNREVLADAGIDDARYEALLAAGIARAGAPGSEEPQGMTQASAHQDLPVWRTLVFVPINVERFVEGAHRRGADAVHLDLEDSVPDAEKDNARRLVEAAARRVRRGGAELVVRINRPLGGAVRDIEACVCPEVDAISVTKVANPSHLQLLDELVGTLEQKRGLLVGASVSSP